MNPRRRTHETPLLKSLEEQKTETFSRVVLHLSGCGFSAESGVGNTSLVREEGGVGSRRQWWGNERKEGAKKEKEERNLM